MHEYDDTGRLVRSVTTREPEWTDDDRAWMYALKLYRSWLCPRCGRLLEECTSNHETGPEFRVSRVRCRATDALLAEQEAAQNIDRPQALLWAVATDS